MVPPAAAEPRPDVSPRVVAAWSASEPPPLTAHAPLRRSGNVIGCPTDAARTLPRSHSETDDGTHDDDARADVRHATEAMDAAIPSPEARCPCEFFWCAFPKLPIPA